MTSPSPLAHVSMSVADLTTGRRIDRDADTPQPLASAAKVLWAWALHAEAPTRRSDRVTIDPHDATTGPTGTSTFTDPVTLSLQDAARLAVTFSDNAAADALWSTLGPTTIRAHCHRVGVPHAARHPMAQVFTDLAATMPTDTDPVSWIAGLPDDQVRALPPLDPSRVNAASARELTVMLSHLHNANQAGDAAAAATIRLMQAAALPSPMRTHIGIEDLTVASATGTLLTLRVEVGLVTYPGGPTYAVAVLTHTAGLHRLAERDAAIALVVEDALRSLRAT